MKKLSVLIALALCLTITGAYATWTFATGNVADVQVTNLQIGMEVEETGSMGTLSATFTPDYSVEPGTGNVPTLTNNAPGQKLVITFTPDENAEASIKADAIAIKVSIAVTTAFTGTANEITKTTVITAKNNNGITINAGDWTDNGDGTFSVSIDSDTVMSWIQINDAAALTDVDTAEAYEAAVKAGRLTITVTPNVG